MKNVTPIEEMPKPARKDPNRKRYAVGKHPQTKRMAKFREEQGAKLMVVKTDAEIEAEILEANAGARVQYMPMKIHMEKAAMALAVGWSRARAGRFAGVNPRQVTKYLQSNRFRERVMEHRQIAMSKIQGQLIKEVGKRVAPGRVETLEPLDLVRFYNMTTGGKDKGLSDGVTVNIKYDAIFNTIAATIQDLGSSGSEGEDFPEYGPEDLLIPGGDSSGE
jgi:hypothetical protein